MPPIAESLEELMLIAAGGVLWWFGGVIKGWLQRKTEERRKEVDAKARLEKDIHDLKKRCHLLQSQIYSYQTVMLKSGYWTLDTLPDFSRDTPTGDIPL